MTEQPGGDNPQLPLQGAGKPSTSKMIVVIENDRLVREATAGLLQSWGYRVVAARSRVAALVSLAKRLPDLVISDYPDDLTAGENIELLRRSFGVPVRVLLIGGETVAEDVSELRTSDHHVLYKPVSPAALRKAIEQLMRS